MLVIGMRGVPAAPYADALADGLICGAPADGRACGACAECALVRAGSHPDRLAVRPEGTGVRIDAVREAVSWAAYRPGRAAVRVVRLDGADRMGAEAAVAALKAVEEPPVATHWILSADAPGHVHAPLRSRCVPLTLRTVAAEQIEAWLLGLGVEASVAGPASADAQGFPADALDAIAPHEDAPPAGGDEDTRTLALAVRRGIHAALRSGRLGSRDARSVLSLWALAELGARRASPSRLVADVLRAAADRLPPPA